MVRHDVIVIGGGLAGLYAAMRILETKPESNVLLLEKSHRLGGRAGNAKFRGATVVCGAGVGRLEKDKLLLSLLETLGLRPQLLPCVTHHYAKTINKVDIVATMNTLRRMEGTKDLKQRKTFKKFALAHLGKKTYEEFVKSTGYTDFEQEDAHDVLYNYGMEDNADGWTPVRVVWDDLVDRMTVLLRGYPNLTIKKKVDITRVVYTKGAEADITVYGTIHRGEDAMYKTKSVVVATTIDTIRNLFPDKRIYNHIHGQSFMRLYAQVATSSRALMASAVPSITIVPAPLQEIIPFDHDKGIYMIGYADNKSARDLHKHQDKHAIESYAERALLLPPGSIQISYIQSHYWPIGTHYYDILPGRFQTREQFIHEAQRPHPSIFIVGEVVAINQGWVEGALQSVDAILDDINLLKA